MHFNVEFPNIGLELTLNRVAISIFGLDIYWYGILIATGAFLGALFLFKNAKRFGVDEDKAIDILMIGAVAAIICGRAYYVIFAPFKYETFLDMIDIRDGGMAIYGSVIGAFVFGYLACKWKKQRILPLFDVVGVGFLIGISVGRWGNFVNQEAFGTNTFLPWAMISEGTKNHLTSVQATLLQQGITVDPTLPVHPTFLYESLWCALGVFLLWKYSYKRKFDGELFLLFLAYYGTGRFLIEGVRTDSLMIGSLRVSQMLALLLVIISISTRFVVMKKLKDKIENEETILYVDILAKQQLELNTNQEEIADESNVEKVDEVKENVKVEDEDGKV